MALLRAFERGKEAEDLAIRIEGLYRDDATAPPFWQEKDSLRKSLRQGVRGMAHEFGLKDLKAVPEQVEEFALKHFAKV